MAKRFECPRCGSGVKPDDAQCFRCGESLKEEMPTEFKKISTIKEIPFDSPTTYGLNRRQPGKEQITFVRASKEIEEKEKDFELREKEVAVKEKIIIASVEQLEKDTKALEEGIHQFELEDQKVREREGVLKQREMQIESLAVRMEAEMKAVENEVSKVPDLAADLNRIKQLSEEYSRIVAEQRRRQKQLLDREIDDRLERLKTLQGLLAVASRQPSAQRERAPGEIMHPSQEMDAKKLAQAVSELSKQVDLQLGSGVVNPGLKVMSTHDEKLDSILGGGIPAGHIILVTGSAGTMKSTLSYFMIHNMAKVYGRTGMYFSLEQKREAVIRQMARMSLPLEDTNGKMMVVDLVELRKNMQDDKGDWRGVLMRYVKNVHSQMPFETFVLDSLDSFKAMSQYKFRREDLKDLFDWFKALNITVFIITERPIEMLFESVQGEGYLADGIIELQMREHDEAKVYRWLRCVKMRGLQNDARYYAFYHTGTGFKYSLPLVDSGS